MKKTLCAFLASVFLIQPVCGSVAFATENSNDLLDELGLTKEVKGAAQRTAEINSAYYDMLDFDNKQESDFATRGLIDAPETLILKDKEGNVIWNQTVYGFLNGTEKAPDTANPSLWENSKNNHVYGLFEVTDGIYQVRGYDMANLTLIEGSTGWIVFDPLMSIECTEAAMELVEKNLGKKPVSAVIISHPHVDHFGGIKGVMSSEEAADASLSLEEQLASGKIPIVVPQGFEESAINENVYAGRAMGRRANYQYGVYLDSSETGRLAMGIGMGQSTGTVSYISPTFEITTTGEKYTIDGVKMEFQLTPGTEAPAEMNIWFPEKNALWVAENCTSTLHNLYTLRGAEVRDGAAWAKYICEAVTRYGDMAEVTFQSHNWPHWGNEVIHDYLINTAAVYQFINDQTLTYINQGYTSDEISNMIKLPEKLAENWYTRQYYGTVAHNAKAVYQKYMGWYDANPVNLNPLSPAEKKKKWVEYMELGSVDDVLRKAKSDFEAGEYQWVAEVTNTIVFAQPNNEAARLLCADALEQLGYEAESGTWRNAYLSAALELRNGNMAVIKSKTSKNGDMLLNMTASNIFDYMSILIDKNAISSYDFSVNIYLTDTQENYNLRFKYGAVLKFENYTDEDARLSITTKRPVLLYMIQNQEDLLKQNSEITGDMQILSLIMENLNEFDVSSASSFNIIEP